MAPRDWLTHYYRTSSGAEIDLLLHDRRGKPIAVEIKLSAAPQVAKGFWTAMDDLRCKKGYVIYPGSDRYPLADNVTALPATDLESVFA
jgi:hypothetical protein